jgi:ABC-type Mn2+/Zn2+ transport system ATPase subunit
MSGKSIIFAGGTGTGKTTMIKERLAKVHKESIHLYDVNSEYKKFYTKPFTDFETFANQSRKLKNALIVYEEATIFLDNKGSNTAVRDVLVRKRHTNCTIFFVFHSLRTIPRWVFDLSNFVVLFKTNDSEKSVNARFDNDLFTDCFLRVQSGARTNPHHHEIFSIY